MDSIQVNVKVTDVIEDIQEAIVQSGGNFQRQKDIREMTVEGLLKILIPNHIVFEVEHIAPKYETKMCPTPVKEFEGDDQ